jgi:hypothetical protein
MHTHSTSVSSWYHCFLKKKRREKRASEERLDVVR